MYYESHFGFSEPPFSISPDPRYLYLTQGHREALAHLLYGVSGGGGFVLLTGEVGSGKTTVCRCLMQQLPEGVDVALVLNPKLSALEFLEAICDELKIEIYGEHTITLKWLVDHIYKYLLVAHSKGRNTVLIVDEAQNLSPDVIEHLRLLTNLETDEKKLLQIILIGQPELRDLIGSPALRQMAQRVTARFHLDLLSRGDAGAYIEHRLKVAGCDNRLFDGRSIRYIWKASGGVPRLMNAISDRALLGASIANQQSVSLPVAKKAASEVLGDATRVNRRPPVLLKVAASLVLVFLLAVSLVNLIPSDWAFPGFSGLSSFVPAKNSPRINEAQDIPQTLEHDTRAGQEDEAGPPPLEAAVAEQPVSEDGDGIIRADAPADGRSAYTRLYQQWGIDHVSRDTPRDCTYLKTLGLRCHTGWTTWKTLLSLNRPAVLGLSGSGPESTVLTLLSLRDDRAVVYAEGRDQVLSTDQLQALWTGRYLLLWQAPSSYNRVVRAGDRGDMVAWISKRLSPEKSELVDIFDEAMARRVRLFQQVYGLVPDGEVGPLTMIALNNFSGVAAPGLREVSVAEATAARE